MRRRGLVSLVVILLLPIVALGAIGQESLYDLVVPLDYTSLSATGGLGGGNAFELDINTAGTLSIDAGIRGDYDLVQQTADTRFNLDTYGIVDIGTSLVGLRLGANNASYTSYTLDIEDMPGFWTAGGSAYMNLSTNSVSFWLNPTAGIGVGRVHVITNVLLAELMMDYLGVPVTEERVRAAVEVMNAQGQRYNSFTDDRSESYVTYIKELAAALGAPDKLLEVTYIAQNQQYAFERLKYLGMLSGWEVGVYANPYIEYSGTFTTSISFGPEADLAGFLLDSMLYYHLNGYLKGVIGGGFSYDAQVAGSAVYLFEDPQWWAEATATVRSTTTTLLSIGVNGEVNYLLNPNTTLFAGLGASTASGFSVYAGGTARIW